MQSPGIGQSCIPGTARGLVVAVAWGLLLSTARVAWAAAPAATGRIELTTSEGCGTSDVLARRVAQRSPRVRLSPGGDGATVVRVAIGPGARKQAGSAVVSATVTVKQGAAAAWTRRVDNVSCAEALDAVALILAVALDPERAAAEAETPPPARATGPGRASSPAGGRRSGRAPTTARTEIPSPPAADGAGGPPAETPSTTAAPAATPPPATPVTPPATNDTRPPEETPPTKPAVSPEQQPPPVPPPEPPVPNRPSVWWGAVGVIGAATTVPAQSVMPGAGAQVWLGVDRGSIWSPAVRLAVSHFWASRFATEAGIAHFTADLAVIDACPLWQHGDNWGVGACAAITAGMVTARGTETFAQQTRHRPFVAPGASVAAAFEPLSDLQVTVWVNGAMPLIRDRFQFEPDVFYEVPRVSLTAGVGVGWRFW